VGKSIEVTDACPPLLLIQVRFHIKSDPELEIQINNRISFMKFISLSAD